MDYYRLLFTQRALSDLAKIIGDVAEDDEQAASQFGTALLDHVDLLKRFPRMGSSTPKRARLRVLVHSPILVYYRIHEENLTVELVHFRHGSRKPTNQH